MVNKVSRSKEKKAQRKEALARLSAAQQLLNTANIPHTDHLEPFKPFQKYGRNDINVTVECKHYLNIDTETFDTLYNILEANMREDYEACYWGWHEKNKRKEMMEKDPWFLIARTEDGEIVAFAHFKFDFDDDIEVLYCYEIQSIERVRGKGLGKFLMQTLELIGVRAGMQKIMVTVFKHNQRAVHFFMEILKYRHDETSPIYTDPIDEREYCYEILSKEFPQKKQENRETTSSSGS